MDPTKISVVSSSKASVETFKTRGADRLPQDQMPPALRLSSADGTKEEMCRACCVAQGAFIAAFSCFAVSAIFSGVCIFFEKRVTYTLNGVMRQAAWFTIPGTLVGATLHFYLAESMWNGRRGSWGQSWFKAFVANTLMWTGAIGASTLLWRKGMTLTARGKELYRRYPVPAEPLEFRMMRSGDRFIANMGWSYWLSGVATGQCGFMSTVAFCVYTDRPYYLMSPYGGYATRCLPRWRRDALEKSAVV